MLNRIQKAITDLKVLHQDWKRFRAVRHLRPGMVITYGAAVRSARVVDNNATGLILDYETGNRYSIETWTNRFPAAVQILPAGTPVGLLRGD